MSKNSHIVLQSLSDNFLRFPFALTSYILFSLKTLIRILIKFFKYIKLVFIIHDLIIWLFSSKGFSSLWFQSESNSTRHVYKTLTDCTATKSLTPCLVYPTLASFSPVIYFSLLFLKEIWNVHVSVHALSPPSGWKCLSPDFRYPYDFSFLLGLLTNFLLSVILISLLICLW